jgi:hypothetical protein
MFQGFAAIADAHQAGSQVEIVVMNRDTWMRRQRGLEATQQSVFLLEHGCPDPAFVEYVTPQEEQEQPDPAPLGLAGRMRGGGGLAPIRSSTT